MSAGQDLGVAWYLYPDESHNSDGKHINYLDQLQIWRDKDPRVFDQLKELVSADKRSTRHVVDSGVIDARSVAGEPLLCESPSFRHRDRWRKEWFDRTLHTLSDCSIVFIVFADPDNGFCDDSKFRYSSRKYWKRLPVVEAIKLADRRTAIFYHHNTRMRGGHDYENQFWLARLPGATFAVKVRAYSVRTFFVLNATEEHVALAQQWCNHFGEKAVFQNSN